jgi:hypothetical protein
MLDHLVNTDMSTIKMVFIPTMSCVLSEPRKSESGYGTDAGVHTLS